MVRWGKKKRRKSPYFCRRWEEGEHAKEPLACGHPPLGSGALLQTFCVGLGDVPPSPRAPCRCLGTCSHLSRAEARLRSPSRPEQQGSCRQKVCRGIIFRRKGREVVIRRPPLSPRVPSGVAAGSWLQHFGPGK